jgi:hypothetical protein
VGEIEMTHKPNIRHDKVSSDYFSLFKKATRRAFAFLRTPRYGFKEVQTVVHPPECTIRYENRTTAVIVSYEWAGSPSVVVSRLAATGSPFDEEEFGLKFFVIERCPEKLDLLERKPSGHKIEQLLIDYARILKECCHDVLTGDFQVFPKLNKLLAAEQRKENLRMFGSESGETPQRDKH